MLTVHDELFPLDGFEQTRIRSFKYRTRLIRMDHREIVTFGTLFIHTPTIPYSPKNPQRPVLSLQPDQLTILGPHSEDSLKSGD